MMSDGIRSRRTTNVVLEQSAQSFMTDDRLMLLRAFLRRSACRQRPVTPGLVWSLRVVMPQVLASQIVQVPRAERHEVIQALLLNRLDEPLCVGVEVRRAELYRHWRHPLLQQQCSEVAEELRVTVVQDYRRRVGVVRKRLTELPRLPGCPDSSGMERARRDPRPAGQDVDEHQHVGITPTPPGQDSPGQEVARPKRLRMNRKELVPRPLTPLGSWVEPMLPQNVGHRGPRDSVNTQLLQLPEDAGITPTCLPSDAKNQLTDFLGSSRATRLFGTNLRRRTGILTQPSSERDRGDNCDQIPDGAAQRPSEFQKSRTLARRQSDLLAEPGAKYFILGLEELDLATKIVS